MSTVGTNINALSELLARPKYEIIPMKNVEKSFPHIPRDAKVSVTVSPTKGIETTLQLAREITSYVNSPVQVTPHISARLVESNTQVKDILTRVQDMGMKEIFIVGGDAAEPAGPFSGSYDLLMAFRELDTDFRFGITAYPEGHPSISDEVLAEDLRRKAPHANFMSTQLCFEAETIKSWLESVRNEGIDTPLQIGVAGVVDMMKLMKISTRIGVGDSIRYFTKHAGTVMKLMTGYKPTDLLDGLMPLYGDDFYKIEGFHVYTFNNLEKTETWRRNQLEELGWTPA